MSMEFCGEIYYENGNGNVHSDICHHGYDGTVQESYRKFLHDCLDEWLNHSKGSGAFWIGDSDYFNQGNI